MLWERLQHQPLVVDRPSCASSAQVVTAAAVVYTSRAAWTPACRVPAHSLVVLLRSGTTPWVLLVLHGLLLGQLLHLTPLVLLVAKVVEVVVLHLLHAMCLHVLLLALVLHHGAAMQRVHHHPACVHVPHIRI